MSSSMASSLSSSSPPPPLPNSKQPPGKPPLPLHYRVRSVSSGEYSSFSKQQQHAQRQQHHHHTSSASASASDLTERAELGLLSNLEGRRLHSRMASGDVWCASVQGERPPLAAVSHAAVSALQRNASSSNASQHSGEGSGNGNNTPQHWRDLARRVVEMNRTTTTSSGNNNNNSGNAAKHKRGASRAHVFLGMIQEDAAQEEAAQDETGTTIATTMSDNNAETKTSTQRQQQQSNTTGLFETVGGDAHLEQGDSLFSVEGTNTDRLFAGASVVNDLFETISEDSSVAAQEQATETTSETRHKRSDASSETIPLMRPDPNDASYGSHSSLSFGNNKRLARKKKGTQ